LRRNHKNTFATSRDLHNSASLWLKFRWTIQKKRTCAYRISRTRHGSARNQN